MTSGSTRQSLNRDYAKRFDGLEVSPCAVVGETAYGQIVEPCDDPADAHFWSVYGHYRAGRVECLADFPTEIEARRWARTLFSRFPHLRFGGQP